VSLEEGLRQLVDWWTQEAGIAAKRLQSSVGP
jgi:hypothetical protein